MKIMIIILLATLPAWLGNFYTDWKSDASQDVVVSPITESEIPVFGYSAPRDFVYMNEVIEALHKYLAAYGYDRPEGVREDYTELVYTPR